MFSSRPFSVLVCLLGLALPALGEKPNDNRSQNSDSRGSDYSRAPSPQELGGKTLEQWIKELKYNRDPYHKSRALMYIVQFGEAAGQYVPDVANALHEGDASPRMKAIIALRMMYVPSGHRGLVIRELGRCLIATASQTIHRYEALQTLMRFGALSGSERDVIVDIVTNLGSTSTYELRSLSIDALLTAGVDKNGPDPRVTDALILRATPFREVAEEVRYKAVMALGALGRPQDPKKLASVVSILKDPGNFRSPNKVIRMWSHVGLMALEDKVYEKELEAIAENLKDHDAAIRAQAAIALGALRDKSHAYVSNICDMAKRETDSFVRTATAQALARMGNKGKRVIDTLLNMIEDATSENVTTVLAACTALKELGVNDTMVIQSLDKAAKQPSLRKFEKEMIEKIIDELKHPPKQPEKAGAKNPEKDIKR